MAARRIQHVVLDPQQLPGQKLDQLTGSGHLAGGQLLQRGQGLGHLGQGVGIDQRAAQLNQPAAELRQHRLNQGQRGLLQALPGVDLLDEFVVVEKVVQRLVGLLQILNELQAVGRQCVLDGGDGLRQALGDAADIDSERALQAAQSLGDGVQR